MTMNATATEPLLSLPARLGWVLGKSFIYGDNGADAPTDQDLKFMPALECGLNLSGEYEGIVLDLKSLLESACKPGGYFLLNCECGIADDAGIDERIFVQHPSSSTIVWELDIQGLRSVLVKEAWFTQQEGYVRLIFDRSQYEADLLRMVTLVRQENSALELDQVLPNDYGFTEYLLALDGDIPFAAEPVLPPGSHLEFRVEGAEFCWLDGKWRFDLPSGLFPRWEVNQAFKKWIDFVQRGFAIEGAARPLEASQFYLLDENCRAACDAAGNELARMLQKSFDESWPPSQITVSYSPCLLSAIT